MYIWTHIHIHKSTYICTQVIGDDIWHDSSIWERERERESVCVCVCVIHLTHVSLVCDMTHACTNLYTCAHTRHATIYDMIHTCDMTWLIFFLKQVSTCGSLRGRWLRRKFWIFGSPIVRVQSWRACQVKIHVHIHYTCVHACVCWCVKKSECLGFQLCECNPEEHVRW